MTQVRLFCLIPVLLATSACAGVQTRQLAFQVGSRQLADDEFWEPLDRQLAVGVDMAILDETGLGGEFGLSASGDDERFGSNPPVKLEARVHEVYGGVRKVWMPDGVVRPHIGAGGALVQAEIEASIPGESASESETSFGLYMRGGVDFFLAPNFFLGLGARYLVGTEIEFPGFVSTDVDGLVVSLRIGFTF